MDLSQCLDNVDGNVEVGKQIAPSVRLLLTNGAVFEAPVSRVERGHVAGDNEHKKCGVHGQLAGNALQLQIFPVGAFLKDKVGNKVAGQKKRNVG